MRLYGYYALTLLLQKGMVLHDDVDVLVMHINIDIDIALLFGYMVCNIKVHTSSQLECILPAKVDLPLCTWLEYITANDCRPQ
jgi:hypothetical protein